MTTLAMDVNLTGVIIVFIVVGLPVALGVFGAIFKSFLKHQREIAQIKISNMSGASQKELDALAARVQALETRCEKLQDQVNLAHDQLSDERRQLDAKLNAMLPDSVVSSADPAKVPARQKSLG